MILAVMEKRLLFMLVAVCLLAHRGFAEGELVLETGGVQIVLPSGWEPLEQPSNYFVQKRAKNVAGGMVLSAGTVKLDMPIQQYVALGTAGLVKGTDSQLDFIARQLGLQRSELDSLMASVVGKQLMDQLKQAFSMMRFDLLRASRQKLPNGTRCQVHTKMTMNDSGQVFYSRQFSLEGGALGEIVTITYVGTSAEIFDMKELADAIRPPAKAIAAQEKEAASYYQRGIQKGIQRDMIGAIADFNKAIELKPDYADAYLKRGMARGGLMKSTNDIDGVLQDYDKAIELKADLAEAYYNRGVAKQAKGEFAAALTDYSKVIQLKPDYGPAYEHRGRLKKSKGDLAGAQEDFNKAAELKPR